MSRTNAYLASVTFLFLVWLVASFSFGIRGPVHGSPTPNSATDISQLPVEVGHPLFLSPHASPIAVDGNHVFVVNTPSDTVDIIDAETREIHTRVNVGIVPSGAPRLISTSPD